MTSTALANVGRQAPPKTATEVVLSIQPEIQRALPKGMDADRIARLALTLIRKDRALAETSPASFAGALLTASALGLEPGLNNEAHLVAYKKECTFILGYGGMTKLFWNHPLAEYLACEAVYENDDFDYGLGANPFLHHTPTRGERGKATHYYAVTGLKGKARTFTVITAEEAKALRGGKVGTKGGIADPMHWMEKKTVLRQHFKLQPKSTEMAQAVEAEDRTGTELHSDLTAQRQIEAPAPSSSAPQHDPETGEVVEGVLVHDGDPNAHWDAQQPEVGEPA